MHSFLSHAIIGLTITLAATAGHALDAKSPSHGPASTGKAMPGYLIANFTILDGAMFQKYRDAVRPLTLKHKGKPVVFNVNARTVEGNQHPIVVVMEFPSLADVERFYFSPEYTEVKKLRLASTEGSIILTEGFVPPQQ